ncbi:glycosyltransferase, partial [Paracoccus sp. PXZ]
MHFSFPDGNAVRINCRDSSALLAAVRQRLAEGRGFAIATINVDHLQRLGEDPRFRSAYAAHDLVCADGNPIVWLS